MSATDNQSSSDQSSSRESSADLAASNQALVDPIPVGSRVIDCSHMGYVEDHPPGTGVGKQSTQKGYGNVIREIVSNQATVGPRVGITYQDIAAIKLDDLRIAEIDAILPAARKLVEMLEETRLDIDNRRHRRIHALAALVDSRARSDRSLLALYEETRKYRSAAGNKAAATRRRNKADAENPPSSTGNGE